jgi:rod shape-determining protein MreC
MKPYSRQKSAVRIAPAFSITGSSGFLFFVVVSSLLLLFSLAKPQSSLGIRTAATDIISPAVMFLNRPFQYTAEKIGSVSGIASLRAENAKLKAENMRLKEWYQTALMLQAENQSLQELLNLKPDPAHTYVTARVISDASNTFFKTIIVSAGREDGLEKNQAVVAGEGMIGRVIETGNNFSRVLLLADINSRVPVIVEGSRQKAIVKGNNNTSLELKHLPLDTSLNVGERVVTSGHGGIFPPGLPIGRIAKNEKGEYAVRPLANLNRISHVRILKTSQDPNLLHGTLTSSGD